MIFDFVPDLEFVQKHIWNIIGEIVFRNYIFFTFCQRQFLQ